MNSFIRTLLFYTRSQRRGALIGIGLIVCIFMLRQWLSTRQSDRTLTETEKEAQARTTETYQAFINQIEEIERKPSSSSSVRKGRVLHPFAFDPNQADSLTLDALGLPDYVIRHLLHYRAKGGVFRQASDFKKIYGVTDQQYRILEPYIRIKQQSLPTSPTPPRLLAESSVTDSLPPFPVVEKYEAGTVVELNGADTTELKKIPGVGSYIARQIVRYRQQLGGYYRLEQLGEIHINYQLLTDWLTIDTTSVQRINVNRAGVERLRHHPYINFYQAKELVEYRRKHGKIQSLKNFILLEEFPPEELERMGHYICFEDNSSAAAH
ncbi:MAG: helix-hairpin-helix domain-containing protein [Mediterranea sp.]|nr:helix-hairpin-helix domain-containing protein [Mediterranea sp.]